MSYEIKSIYFLTSDYYVFVKGDDHCLQTKSFTGLQPQNLFNLYLTMPDIYDMVKDNEWLFLGIS